MSIFDRLSRLPRMRNSLIQHDHLIQRVLLSGGIPACVNRRLVLKVGIKIIDLIAKQICRATSRGQIVSNCRW